jgi:hypothetical protein
MPRIKITKVPKFDGGGMTPPAPPSGAGNMWGNLATNVSNIKKDARQTEGLMNPGTYNPFDTKWGQERVNPEIDITGPMSHKPLDRYGTSSSEGTSDFSRAMSGPSNGTLNTGDLVKGSGDDDSGDDGGGGGFWGSIKKGFNDFTSNPDPYIGITSGFLNLIENKKRDKRYNKWLRESMLPDNYYAVNTNMYKGDYDINNGMLGDYGFKSKGVTANAYYPQQGFAADGMTIEGDKMVQPAMLPDLPPLFIPGSRRPSAARAKSQQTFDIPSDSNIANIIAEKESGGNYLALPKKKDGTLASSAVGKYQFLWGKHKDWISQVTGETTKTGFMHNPEAQEKAFQYWDKNVLTPNAMKIKQELGVDAPLNNIKYAIHFAGPTGAYKYFATGEETTDAFGSTTSKYAGVRKSPRQTIDQNQQLLALNDMLVRKDGGENNNTMKIKIVGIPDENKMAAGGQPKYSGQTNYGLYIGQRNLYSTMAKHPYEDVKNTVSEKPETDENPYKLEAEGGETIARPDGSHSKIVGPRHTNGGVKLNEQQAPEGSFIFSDTKKMIIKDPKILKEFGMPANKSGYTPAEIAKRYDTNKYRAILADPNTDNLQKNTAKRMLDVYEKKLAELAMVQEGMKGFPQGIPEISKKLFNEQEQQPQQGPEEEMAEGPEGQEVPEQEMMEEQPPMQRLGGGLKKYQGTTGGSTVNDPSGNQFGMGPYYKSADDVVATSNKYPWFKPYTNPKTKAGTYSRTTGKPTFYNPTEANQYQNVDYWAQQAAKNNVPINDIAGLQNYVYGQLNTSNPGSINEMWNQYGPTLQSNERNQQNFADAMAGRRTAFLLGQRPEPEPTGKKPPLIRSVPGRVKSIVQVPPQEEDIKPQDGSFTENITPGDFNGTDNQGVPYGWTQQDMNNLGAAGMNASLMKKYHMQSRKLQPVLPEFIPVDWRGYAASLQSGANSAARQLGTYQPGQGMAANLSFLAGQQAENLGKYIGQTDEANAKGLTDASEKRANIMNAFNQYNAGKTDYDYDYDNTADSKWRANLGHAYDRFTAANNQGITNAAGLFNTNISESPDYYIGPRYGTMKFNGPEAYARAMTKFRGGYQDQSSDIENRIKMIRSLRSQGFSQDELKLIFGSQASSGSKQQEVTYPNNYMKNKYVNTRNGVQQGYYSQNPYSSNGYMPQGYGYMPQQDGYLAQMPGLAQN